MTCFFCCYISGTDVDEQANQAKLQQAMLRRQELLDKIKVCYTLLFPYNHIAIMSRIFS